MNSTNIQLYSFIIYCGVEYYGENRIASHAVASMQVD